MSGTLAAQPDFLTRMADKALGTGIVIRPRVRSVFEPSQQQQQQQQTWIGASPDWPEEIAALVETAPDRQPHEPPELAGPNGRRPQGSVSVASGRNDGSPVASTAAEERLASPARPNAREAPQEQPLAAGTRRRDRAADAQPARPVESAAALHDGAAGIRSPRLQQQPAAITQSPDASSRPAARNNQTSTDHLAPAVVATPALPPRRAQHTAMEEYRRPHPSFADESVQGVLVPASDARVLFAASSVQHRSQPEARRGEQPEEPATPVVNVTIGRVEVRAAAAPPAPAPRAARGQAPLSLDEYLKGRSAR